MNGAVGLWPLQSFGVAPAGWAAGAAFLACASGKAIVERLNEVDVLAVPGAHWSDLSQLWILAAPALASGAASPAARGGPPVHVKSSSTAASEHRLRPDNQAVAAVPPVPPCASRSDSALPAGASALGAPRGWSGAGARRDGALGPGWAPREGRPTRRTPASGTGAGYRRR